MNPRQDSAPLTYEDSRIMEEIRQRWRYPLNRWYQYYDRQAALLMLNREMFVEQCTPAEAWCCEHPGCVYCSETFPVSQAL